MKKVQVTSGAQKFLLEIYREDGHYRVVTESGDRQVDLVPLGHNRYSLIIGSRSHEIGVMSNLDGYVVSTGTRSGQYQVEDFEIAKLKRSVGITGGDRLRRVTAPMPGLVIHVLCRAGDEIKKDQPLVVMEAMKMENDIKAPYPGKIKQVYAEKGKSVEKGQTLVELE